MELLWIVGGGVVMSAIALVGSVTTLMSEAALRRLQVPLVALAAGTMLGGAFFHLLPGALAAVDDKELVWSLVAAGFIVFFLLEQMLHRHHRQHGLRAEPFNYLVLVGDGLHNFLGGVTIASSFMVDPRLGVTAWLAAALHEIPQELGDFAVLVQGGWSKRRALLLNLLSGLTFLIGGVLTWWLAQGVDTSWLVPVAAGSFLYIGASDLMPEVNRHTRRHHDWMAAGCFAAGLLILWLPLALG